MSQPFPSAPTMDDNHRAEARRRVMKSGKITFGDFMFARDCALRDVSGSGARISIAGAHEVPNEFFLVFSSDRSMRRAVVRWRSSNELGVHFEGEPISLVGNKDPRLRQFMF